MASEYHVDYSGLQVVPDNSPQVAPDRTLPQAIAGPEKLLMTEKDAYIYDLHKTVRTRQICGFSRKVFYALVAGAVMLVLAAIGGGIGGALSRRNTSDKVAASATTNGEESITATQAIAHTTSATATTATTATTRVTQTVTQIVGPSQTLLRDCPASNDTIYTSPDTSQQFRKLCNNLFLGVPGNIINRRVESLNNCIDMCAQWNQDSEADIRTGERNPCSTVCWRNTLNSDYPGQCFGWTMANTTSGHFNISTQPKDVECDSAAWINVWSTS